METIRKEVAAGKEMKSFSVLTESGGLTYLVCRAMDGENPDVPPKRLVRSTNTITSATAGTSSWTTLRRPDPWMPCSL